MSVFGFGYDSLKQGLHGPGFAIACALPKDGGDFLGCSLFQQGSVKAFLEAQAAAGDPGRIAGLPRLPSVLISGFELGLRIAGFAGLKF